MKHRIPVILLFAALIVAPAAHAEGGYFGLFAGANDLDDTSFATALGAVGTTFDSGLNYGVTLGRSFGDWRLEGELSRRESDVDTHALGGAVLAGSTGEFNLTSLMGNLYWDFATDRKVSPYVGLGVGMAMADVVNWGVAVVPDVVDDDDDVLAYQGILGLSVDLANSWAFTAEARFFETDSVAVTTSAVAGAVATEVDYSSFDLNLGLRYSF